jgi:hypothetical protein
MIAWDISAGAGVTVVDPHVPLVDEKLDNYIPRNRAGDVICCCSHSFLRGGCADKLIYTLMWDNSSLADDAAKDRDRTQRRMTFQRALDNMKILAEGGTLPPGPLGTVARERDRGITSWALADGFG